MELTSLWWSVHTWTTVDEMFEQLMAIKRTMRGEDDGGSVDEMSVEAQRRRDRFKKRRRRIPCQ